MPQLAWTLARADVSSDATLGYSFGWMEKGHYAAVWRRQGGDWKLAVFLQKAAEPEASAPPAWFVPFRENRESVAMAATESVSAADTVLTPPVAYNHLRTQRPPTTRTMTDGSNDRSTRPAQELRPDAGA